MPQDSFNQKIFTIHELNSLVRGLIHTAFPDSVWVTGEIQGLRERSGIINFDLVQKDTEKDITLAKASSVIFQNFSLRITKRLREIDPSLELKNDVEVKGLIFIPRTANSRCVLLISILPLPSARLPLTVKN